MWFQYLIKSIFSEDGNLFASYDSDYSLPSIKVWNYETLENINRLTLNEEADTVIFSPDSSLIAGGTDKALSENAYLEAYLINGHDQVFNSSFHVDDITDISFLSDSNRLVFCSRDHTIQLWDIAKEQLVYPLGGMETEIYSIAVSNDDRFLAVGGVSTLQIFSLDNYKVIQTYDTEHLLISDMVFSPDGNILATAGYKDKTIKLWDTQTWELIKTLSGHEGPITRIVFSPEGDFLISSSMDYSKVFWNIKTGDSVTVVHSIDGGWISFDTMGHFEYSAGMENFAVVNSLGQISSPGENSDTLFKEGLLAGFLSEIQ